ncbi:MAG: membrane protein insertase YidC [Candidatus Omnitrophica bacterium]|nr:membrane protein insertase YidC [Candidatus Omnitrophota bacterium]
MEKRMIVAIALSLMILLGFQFLGNKNKPQVQPEYAPSGTAGTQTETGPAAPRTSSSKEQKALEEKLTEVYTENYRAVFSDIGGSMKKLVLVTIKGEDTLFEEEVLSQRPFALESSIIAGLEAKKYEMSRGDNYVEYTYTEPGWIELTKRYVFPQGTNRIDLMVSVRNIADRSINFSYSIIGPADLIKADNIMGRRFLEANAMIDGKLWREKSVKQIEERMGNISWIGLKNRYFAVALKPFTAPKTAFMQKVAGKNLLTGLRMQSQELAPGTAKEDEFFLYAGTLDEKKLAAIGYSLEELVDFGFFGALSKVLLSILAFFHNWTHNWGLAIICLTILINFLLFPLTFKSFASMQQMKKIQPHMQKLKELHKDNPQKLNKEMMELYKKYNVNPLGGCLPLLLQMPIFIALYQGLMRFIELKGSDFLWIKDLAKPDAVPLPFSLPVLGSSINVLPLLMVGMMVVQQKLSQSVSAGAMTDEQASQQKIMMLMMPLLFGFLFYKMPSGLVLYWLTNTILMSTEQTIIGKRLAGD